MNPPSLQNLYYKTILKYGLDYSVLPKLLQKNIRTCKCCDDVFILDYEGYLTEPGTTIVSYDKCEDCLWEWWYNSFDSPLYFTCGVRLCDLGWW
jgi:hypothetical protein